VVASSLTARHILGRDIFETGGWVRDLFAEFLRYDSETGKISWIKKPVRSRVRKGEK